MNNKPRSLMDFLLLIVFGIGASILFWAAVLYQEAELLWK